MAAPIWFCWNVVFNRSFIIKFTRTNRLPSGSEFFSMASSHTDMDNAIATAAHSLGYVLKPEQRTSIFQFARGSDVFVSLPTGYGKSLCYTLLPPVFDLLRGIKEKSIVLVVSPMLALRKDQVASISEKDLSAVFISDKDSTPPTVKREI